MLKFNRRYIAMMKMHSTMNTCSSRCGHTAEACTHARISAVMDTAISLVVSILVVCILSLRLCTVG